MKLHVYIGSDKIYTNQGIMVDKMSRIINYISLFKKKRHITRSIKDTRRYLTFNLVVYLTISILS